MGVETEPLGADGVIMRRWTMLARERLALRDESGIALIMALGILFVLTISLGTVIYVTSASARHAEHSNAGQKAHALSEAGVHQAMALLNSSYPDTTNVFPGDRCLLHPQAPPAGFPGNEPFGPACAVASAPFTSTPDAGRPNETVTWWGRLRFFASTGFTWVIRSTGSVPNPTGPGAAPVTRTTQVKVPVKIADPELPNPGVLEWLYSPTSATALNSVEIKSPFYTRGNLLIGNGVEVYAPLYVTCVKPPAPVPTTTFPCPPTAGNVRMENTGEVFQGADPSAVTVSIGGRLTQTSPQNTVGTSSKPISAAHIVNGCETSTDPYNASCQWGSVHDVFVSGVRDRLMPPDPVPVPPVIDWPFWYAAGSPGPLMPCQSGTTPMFESTGSTALDNSLPTVFNLMQPSSYSCKTLTGELSWDAPSKTLTVIGTVYFDGSVKIEKSWGGQQAAQYQGKGAIYMSGSFEFKNTALCAVRDDKKAGDDSLCDLSAWDPEVAALSFVAKSKGSDPGAQAASGNNSVEIKSSEFQGIISGEHDILSETTSIVQGPVISFQGGLHISQTSGASFPDITFPPAGAPGTPPPPSILLEPREFEGG